MLSNNFFLHDILKNYFYAAARPSLLTFSARPQKNCCPFYAKKKIKSFLAKDDYEIDF